MPPSKRSKSQRLPADPKKRRMKQVDPDEQACESNETCENMMQQDDENLSNPTQRLEYIAGKALKLAARCVVDNKVLGAKGLFEDIANSLDKALKDFATVKFFIIKKRALKKITKALYDLAGSDKNADGSLLLHDAAFKLLSNFCVDFGAPCQVETMKALINWRQGNELREFRTWLLSEENGDETPPRPSTYEDKVIEKALEELVHALANYRADDHSGAALLRLLNAMTEFKFLTNKRVCERVKELMRKIEDREALRFESLIPETQEPPASKQPAPQHEDEWHGTDDGHEEAPMSQWPQDKDEGPPGIEPIQVQPENQDGDEGEEPQMSQAPEAQAGSQDDSQRSAPPPKTYNYEDNRLFKAEMERIAREALDLAASCTSNSVPLTQQHERFTKLADDTESTMQRYSCSIFNIATECSLKQNVLKCREPTKPGEHPLYASALEVLHNLCRDFGDDKCFMLSRAVAHWGAGTLLPEFTSWLLPPPASEAESSKIEPQETDAIKQALEELLRSLEPDDAADGGPALLRRVDTMEVFKAAAEGRTAACVRQLMEQVKGEARAAATGEFRGFRERLLALQTAHGLLPSMLV